MRKYLFLIISILFLLSFKPSDCTGEKKGFCSINFKEVIKTEEGILRGKIVCKKCDLNQSDKCTNVLFTSDEKVYEFCTCSNKNKEIEKLSGKEIEVKGKICTLKDNTFQIHSESIKII